MRYLGISIIIVLVLLTTISPALSNDPYAQTDIISNQFVVGDTVEQYRKFDGDKGWRSLNEKDSAFNTQWYVVAITDDGVTLRLTYGRYRFDFGDYEEFREGFQTIWSSSVLYNDYFPGRPKTDQIFKMFRRVGVVYFEDIVSELAKLSIPTNATEIITLKKLNS